MFSHIVVFWTKPGVPNATEDLLAGAAKYFEPIPGVRHFHIGRMAPSQRPVVDQTYQAALNVVFRTRRRRTTTTVHPLHIEFIEKVFKRVCDRVVVYDFE